MKSPSALEDLIQALRCLPGVGPKSAQRMAYHLLQRDQPGALRLAGAMKGAVERIRHCALCNTFTELEVCEICTSGKRDKALLCVVETPADLLMMEQTQSYRGLYFVLMGKLSPLDGIGPRDIHLDRLVRRAWTAWCGRSSWQRTLPLKARRQRITSAKWSAISSLRLRALHAGCLSVASLNTWTAERWRRP